MLLLELGLERIFKVEEVRGIPGTGNRVCTGESSAVLREALQGMDRGRAGSAGKTAGATSPRGSILLTSCLVCSVPEACLGAREHPCWGFLFPRVPDLERVLETHDLLHCTR